jgi:membrane protein implicated in regulation of membrane protease activity
MYLVAIGWMFVVVMMAAAEAMSPIGTLLGAFFTLVLYGLLPLSIVLYVMGAPMRRRARRAAEEEEIPSVPPDSGSHAAGDAVAPVREEP